MRPWRPLGGHSPVTDCDKRVSTRGRWAVRWIRHTMTVEPFLRAWCQPVGFWHRPQDRFCGSQEATAETGGTRAWRNSIWRRKVLRHHHFQKLYRNWSAWETNGQKGLKNVDSQRNDSQNYGQRAQEFCVEGGIAAWELGSSLGPQYHHMVTNVVQNIVSSVPT